LNYVLKGAISSGEGRNVASTDRGLNYTGRIELLPLGEFKNRGDYFEGDLEREEIPKISLAGGMNFNELAMRTAGTLGKDLYQPRSMETYIFDGLMKYRGFALYLEYMKRWAENPITSNNENQKRHVFTGNGMLVQSSYLLKNNYEIAARYAIVTPTPTIRSVEKKEEVITAGLTKYLIRHKLKVQGNVSYHKSDNYIASPAEHWSIGFQLELGI
jgi:phosphate-selective porin OprO and OprP